ncbi:MAG: nucleotidyltransferase [Deltaproteobacteria bacterium]|nr:nucleotidyltransferase [Deltaproteobacteria bacterium]TLN00283.1 MAG: nucleotidyltransferase [bacterium]
MSVPDMFRQFLANLAISNAETISMRYGELTSALNKEFRNTDSKIANTLQVGSFGRKTGVNGISDLDMLYIMPKSKWETYKDGRQLKLLQDVKAAIMSRYQKTDIRVDRYVVTVTYVDFHVEVQPVFEQDDGSFKYPDTKNGGAWKITKPREEMNAVAELDTEKNSNLRRLCKMARSWRNKHGVGMGGLLVDTLAYNFLKSTNVYDAKSFLYYDELSRDFFKYLSELPNQDRYSAPGSNQHVKVKKAFQRKGKKAYDLCLKAIEAEGTKCVNDKWKKVFGRPFPANVELAQESAIASISRTWNDTEQFIEDLYPVDIRYTLKIDCEVKQNGFRENSLRRMLASKIPLLAKKTLEFEIVEIDVPGEYSIEWKVLNRGDEALRRNLIRGQIVRDAGNHRKTEPTSFRGDHVVECYAIQNGVVVAKDRIHVPISTNG